MSFFANALEKAKRELTREPRGGRSAGKRLVIVGVLMIIATLMFVAIVDPFLGEKPDLLMWLTTLTLAAYFVLLGAAALLYESRRTLAILLRLASTPFAVACFVLFVTHVLERGL